MKMTRQVELHRQDYLEWINKRARLAKKHGFELGWGFERTAWLIQACEKRGLSDDETEALVHETDDLVDSALAGRLKTIADMKSWFDLVESKLYSSNIVKAA